MKLKYNILIFMILFSVIPVIMMGIYFVHSADKRIEDIMEENLKINCSVQRLDIENFFRERKRNLLSISESALIHEMVSRKEGKELQASERFYLDDMLLQRVENNNFLESMTVTDKNFNIIGCSSTYESEVAEALKNADDKFLTGEFIMSNIITINTYGNKADVVVCIMGIIEENEIIGYIVEEVNMSFFERLRLDTDMWENGTLYLIDGNGKLITAGGNEEESREEFVLRKEDREDFNTQWEKVDLEKQPVGKIKYDIGGKHYITHYSAIEHSEWVIMDSINLTDFQMQQSYYRIIAALVILLYIFIILVANYLINRKIIKPVERIENTLALVQEKQEYNIRIPVKSKDEIGHISVRINELLGYIEKVVEYERERAEKDSLTGVYNNESSNKILREMIIKASVEQTPIACLFLDLDDFKNINTQYGHLTGDKVLVFTANILQKVAGKNVGRLGGDEFMVCINEEAAINRLDEMLTGLIRLLNHGFQEKEEGPYIQVSCCVGAVISRNGNLTGEELLKKADEVMYHVKEKGKNNFEIMEC